MNRTPITVAEYMALREAVQTDPDATGPDLELVCSTTEHDHLHVSRLGAPGQSYGRAGLRFHSPDSANTILVSATEARVLAAHLLDIADELDGTVPLVFFPRDPDGSEVSK